MPGLPTLLTDAPTEPRADAALWPLPLVALERYFLLESCAPYPMTYPVELHFEGQIDRQAFGQALRVALGRHPLLASRVGICSGQVCWLGPESVPPNISWTTSAASEAADERIDLFREPGLKVVVRQEGEQAVVTLLVHHACCDGEGTRRLIADLLTAYAQMVTPAARGRAFDRLDPMQLRTRGRLDAPPPVEPISTWQKLREAWGFHVLRPRPLAAWAQTEPVRSGAADPVRLTAQFSREETKQLIAHARASGVTPNEVALALLFQTLAAWNCRHGAARADERLRILMPTDLRSRGDRPLPAANRVGFGFLTRRVGDRGSWQRLLAGVQAETQRIQRARLDVDFLRGLELALRVPKLVPAVSKLSGCMATAVLTNLGDPSRRLARQFPAREGLPVIGNLMLQAIQGAPPLRRGTRAGFGLCFFASRLAITAQCDSAFFDRAGAEALLGEYLTAWRRWGGLPDVAASRPAREFLDGCTRCG